METIDSIEDESVLTMQSVENISTSNLSSFTESSIDNIKSLNNKLIKQINEFQNEYKQIKSKLRDTEERTVDLNVEKYKYVDEKEAMEVIENQIKSEINFFHSSINLVREEKDSIEKDLSKLLKLHTRLQSNTNRNETEIMSSCAKIHNNEIKLDQYLKLRKKSGKEQERMDLDIIVLKRDIEAKEQSIRINKRNYDSVETKLQSYRSKEFEAMSIQKTNLANLTAVTSTLDKELAQRNQVKSECKELKEKVRSLKIECENRIKTHNATTFSFRHKIDELKKQLQNNNDNDNFYIRRTDLDGKNQLNDTLGDLNQTLTHLSITKCTNLS